MTKSKRFVAPDSRKAPYTLGLRMGGLMEDPEWHVEIVRTVYAPSLREAKQKWAEETGHAGRPEWNAANQTYWGWEIVEA